MSKRRRKPSLLAAPWLAYTDLLSSTLMILTIAIVVSTLGKALNQKPPIIRLSDDKNYRFSSGSYSISKLFKQQLVAEQLPNIKRVLHCYGIDTIEIIGHTDSSPNTGSSNLDQFQDRRKLIHASGAARSGSNADLGLLRALSVENLLKESLEKDFSHISYRSYSAASFVDPDVKNKASSMTQAQKQQAKRRIEVRFTRSEYSNVMPKC
jgi:outer membrane protein OmpA-like peptidoglycan-associated protein